ncbi:hypothetical protein DL96DRAFT_1706089 [Flagelloscypha sp. PMI_526]|nr:hypothetical protein DL96DRAFT_1706089 [Flagelloscypha sp. PMI_526]
MTAMLPPELWLQIVFLLPPHSQESFKMVCRAFNSLVLTRQLTTLDLAFEFTKPEHMQEQSKRRLDLASDKPHLVRVLRLQSAYPQPIEKRDHNFRALKHLLKHFHSAPPTFDLDARLVQLIPCLTQVRELHIIDQYQPTVRPNQSLQLTWKTFSSMLTTLSVRIFDSIANTQCLPQIEYGIPALPLLQTLKLQYCSTRVPEDPDLWRTINFLTSQSPLLEEVQYEFGQYVPRHGPAIWFPANPTIYPKLRVFKWISLQTDSRGPSVYFISTIWNNLQTFLRAFARQLRILHIDAFRGLGFWEGIDLSSLAELRLDLYYGDPFEDSLTRSKIGQMSALTVLEICGCRWNKDMLYHLFPPMPSLRELYFPIHADSFSRHSLNGISVSTQNLQKLVFRYEYGPTMEAYKLVKIVKSFRYPSTPDFLEGWGLQDFGILNPSLVIPTEYKILLQCVTDATPSIKLLYGRKDWTILKGDKIDIDWDGQLTWMGKHWVAR